MRIMTMPSGIRGAWCERRDSNPHGDYPLEPKSSASTNFATWALLFLLLYYYTSKPTFSQLHSSMFFSRFHFQLETMRSVFCNMVDYCPTSNTTEHISPSLEHVFNQQLFQFCWCSPWWMDQSINHLSPRIEVYSTLEL